MHYVHVYITSSKDIIIIINVPMVTFRLGKMCIHWLIKGNKIMCKVIYHT